MSQISTVQKAFDIIEQDPSKVLGVRIASGEDLKPGQYVPRKALAAMPSFTWKGPAGTYIMMKIDLDAPFPSLNIMSPIAHYIQIGVTIAPDGKLAMDENVTPIAGWAPPGPPPFSAPHRYVFMLFPQPQAFKAESEIPDGKSWSMLGCARFDLAGFLQRNGISAEPVAATFVTSN